MLYSYLFVLIFTYFEIQLYVYLSINMLHYFNTYILKSLIVNKNMSVYVIYTYILRKSFVKKQV